MEITEVRVKLVGESSERVKAFCSVTLDHEFVIRDLKVIEGTSGLFLAMPSRKLADRCPKCSGKNHLRARFCNYCGGKLNENRAPRDDQGRAKLHADVAHPINAACRETMQTAVIDAYSQEVAASQQPGYQPQTLDDHDDTHGEFEDFLEDVRDSVAAARGMTGAPRGGGRESGGGRPEGGVRQVPPRERGATEIPRDAAASDRGHGPRGGGREERLSGRGGDRRDSHPPHRDRRESVPVEAAPPVQPRAAVAVKPPPVSPAARKPASAEEDDFGAGIL